MNKVNHSLVFWLIFAIFACGGAALAQDKTNGYPVRPVRLIVTVAPGAGTDAIAREVAQMLSAQFSQNVVVDNRPGGTGVIATELVARSAPDGYTLLIQGDTLLLLGATKRVPFDVLKTFDPIVATAGQPYILLVNLALPFKSIKEMVAYSAKQTLTYSGSSGVGGTVHLGMEWFAQLSGAKLLFVPYKGSAPAIVAAMGGEIHMAAGSTIAASAAIRTGKVRALATLGLTRLQTMPDLPTVAEQGYPGFKITNRYNIYAPAGTPRPIINAINRTVSAGMHTPRMAQRLAADGSQPAERMSPEELKATLAREYIQYEQQITRLNIKMQ